MRKVFLILTLAVVLLQLGAATAGRHGAATVARHKNAGGLASAHSDDRGKNPIAKIEQTSTLEESDMNAGGLASAHSDDRGKKPIAKIEQTSTLEESDTVSNSLDVEEKEDSDDEDDAVSGDELSSSQESATGATLKEGTAARAGAPYAYSPRRQNWWSTFDRRGWSSVPTNTWITGLWRNSCHHLHCLEEAYYSKPKIGGWGRSMAANWWASFDHRGWSSCPIGYALTGLWRNSCHGLHCLEQGMCRMPSTGPGFTSCYTHNVWGSFDRKGLSACKPGYFIAGFWRNTCNQLHCIEEFKCCTQPGSAVQQVAPRQLVKSGSWSLSKGRKLGTVKLSSAHTLSFSVYPRGRIGAWQSILHFGNSNHQRGPAIWFYPGQTRMHIRMGRQNGGWNWGCDPAFHLPLNQWSQVVVVSVHAYTRVYINGVKHIECRANSHLLHQNNDVAVWASDPWYHAAVATVQNVKFYSSVQPSLVPRTPGTSLIKSGSWSLRQSNQIGAVKLSSAHTLSFSVYPRGRIGAWQSILHFGLADNQRGPAIWFFPHQTRMHIRMGRQNGGWNWGCDPTYHLPLNQWSQVVVVSVHAYTRVYINGALRAQCNANSHLLHQNSEVPVWASDPWYHAAVASVKDVKFYSSLQSSLIPKPQGSSLYNGNTWRLRRGNRFGTVKLSSAHTVSFSVRPVGRIGAWQSILHFGNSDHQRGPAIWFYPGRTRMHIRMGRQNGGWNWGCDPTYQLPLGHWSSVKIVSTYAYTRVYINGALRAQCNANSHLLYQGNQVSVWASDPWHHAAIADIRQVRFQA